MGDQFEIYPPKLQLITHAVTISKSGRFRKAATSDEPPLKIAAPLGRQSADIGIVLDPLHKEVIIATAAGNTIMTFFVPEVFDDAPASTQVTSASK